MKTTLDLNEELLSQAKREATAAGSTLEAFVEEALRARLAERQESGKPFRLDLPVVEGRRPPAIEVSDRRALYEFLEQRP